MKEKNILRIKTPSAPKITDLIPEKEIPANDLGVEFLPAIESDIR